ncbi:hypothetical protein BaRGS_00033011 [Batillaria attramentaria]|uniref:Uncharacterized protein n=1 Tax=Batillaria attramentaria TaxID=370345 RepID=A0ABD0JLK9_9CAEN
MHSTLKRVYAKTMNKWKTCSKPSSGSETLTMPLHRPLLTKYLTPIHMQHDSNIHSTRKIPSTISRTDRAVTSDRAARSPHRPRSTRREPVPWRLRPWSPTRWDSQVDPRLAIVGAPSSYQVETPAYALRRINRQAPQPAAEATISHTRQKPGCEGRDSRAAKWDRLYVEDQLYDGAMDPGNGKCFYPDNCEPALIGAKIETIELVL